MTAKPQPIDSVDKELGEIFSTLNGSGAHACYCDRSTDGGCECALKDEYLVIATKQITHLINQKVLEGRIEEVNRVPNNRPYGLVKEHIRDRLAELSSAVQPPNTDTLTKGER